MTKPHTGHRLGQIRVVRSVADKRKGTLFLGSAAFPCALGRCGIGLKTREGDGTTPRGSYRVGRLHVRKDRVGLAGAHLKARRIAITDWWSDDVQDRSYNRLVTTRPIPKHSKEGLWRDDALYDVFFEVGYNQNPEKRHRGSGIFMHLARKGYLPTEGCVAVSMKTMRQILARIGKNTQIRIG